MKKIVGTIAAIALATSAAFAEVGIGSWGRAIWAPVQGVTNDNNEMKLQSWEGVSWGSPTSRVGISVHGGSENVGFNLDLNADGFANAGIGDLACFWAKPWDFLEVKVGKTQDDTGRGNVAYGIFNWIRFGGDTNVTKVGEDVTFTRFGNGGGGQAKGAIVKVTPVEGLWAIAAFDVQDNADAGLTYGQHSQYGLGYNIANIGHIRAQYICGENAWEYGNDAKYVSKGKINAAFDLTAVEGLNLTVGAYVPMAMKVDGERVKIAAGADFAISAVTLHALFVCNLPQTLTNSQTTMGVTVSTTKVNNFDAQFGVGADFDFGNGIGLTADVRFSTETSNTVTGSAAGVSATTTTKTADSELVFLVGLTKSLSNGMIGIGFEGDAVLANTPKFNWYVPVVISAWF